MEVRIFGPKWMKEGVAKQLRRVAFQGMTDGAINNRIAHDYLQRCGAYHSPSGTYIRMTRDTGAHSSGWWKNPDYERCIHVSISFKDIETRQPIERNLLSTAEWLPILFEGHHQLCWSEPPTSEHGKKLDVWHYRVFYHPDWKTPILPRGEVYSKQFTEHGWKSFSDVQAEIQAERDRLLEIANN